MMNEHIFENRKHIAGELDTSLEAIRRAKETVENMWNSESYRMSIQEIERAKKYLAGIKREHKEMVDLLEQFTGIAMPVKTNAGDSGAVTSKGEEVGVR